MGSSKLGKDENHLLLNLIFTSLSLYYFVGTDVLLLLLHTLNLHRYSIRWF
jgi:hypothetical protein